MSAATLEYGLVKGEVCNRAGCAGIIEEHMKGGSCSCHINPPCSYCTTDSSYCPECDWEAGYEPAVPIDLEVEKRNQEYYQRENEKWQAARTLFYKRFSGIEPIEKLEMRNQPHTHFSQILKGVFPKGTETRETIEPKVKGTFGGRFVRFDDYCFEYIAYTD